MTRSVRTSLCASSFALLASLSFVESAHAAGSTQLALDLDFGNALDSTGTEAGGGGALRFGKKLDLLLVSLTPEIGGAYHTFSGDDESKVYRGFIGGRLGVGKIIEPSIFAHLGIGRHSTSGESRTAPALDAGIALDFTLIPFINLGVHGGYNVLTATDDQDALKFYTLGVQVALLF